MDFGGLAASQFRVHDDSEIDASSPSALAAGPVDVTVTTPFSTSATSSADQFTYFTPPTVM